MIFLSHWSSLQISYRWTCNTSTPAICSKDNIKNKIGTSTACIVCGKSHSIVAFTPQICAQILFSDHPCSILPLSLWYLFSSFSINLHWDCIFWYLIYLFYPQHPWVPYKILKLFDYRQQMVQIWPDFLMWEDWELVQSFNFSKEISVFLSFGFIKRLFCEKRFLK